MQPENPPSSPATFLEIARQRAMLSEDEAKTIQNIADSKEIGSSEAALQTGLMKPVEVEIVEAFIEPDELAPGYALKDVLGFGALGVVYRAYQSRLQRDVAIKSIIPSCVNQQNSIARFQQEGTLIGRLKHPNIVAAYDSGCHRDRLYLVMELVEGQDLREKLESGPLDAKTSLLILRQSALGLAHAISHGIIHRDIKPGNLILTEAPAGFDIPEGVPLVKIADFGLAQLNSTEDDHVEETRLTVVGTAMGTPMYSAPEQLTGDPIDFRVDIYALGATLFHMLAGKTPFESSKISKIIAAKVTGKLPQMELLPANLDPAIRALLLDLMHHDIGKRVSDYPQLIARIDEILTPGAVHMNPALMARESHTTADRIPPSTAQPLDYMKVIRVSVTLLIVGFLVATVIIFPDLMRTPATPDMTMGSWSEPLFDGKTLTGFSPATDGLWYAAFDYEGGNILSGKGSIKRPFPKLPTGPPGAATGYGFKVGINLTPKEIEFTPGTASEVQFGFADSHLDECTRFSVLYDSDQIIFGTRAGTTGKFTPLGRPVPIVSEEHDDPTYAEIRVELHRNHWFIFFNGKLLQDAPVDRQANNRILRLVAKNGTVHFEDLRIFNLVATPAVTE